MWIRRPDTSVFDEGWVTMYDTRLGTLERVAMDATPNHIMLFQTIGSSVQTLKLKNALVCLAMRGKLP